MTGGSGNRAQSMGMPGNTGSNNNNGGNGNGNVGYGNQMGSYGQNNGGQGNNNLGWNSSGGKVQGMNGGAVTPGASGGGMNMGDGHNDAGGFDQWDNWNFAYVFTGVSGKVDPFRR